jgi:hypothetical protein
MSSDKPTVEMGQEGRSQQTDDQDKPTIAAGQEASVVPPTIDAEGAPFRPTNPPQYPTPPSPAPFRPVSPPTPSSAPSAPGGETMMMEAETAPVPLAWLAVVEGVGGPSGYIHKLDRETVVGRTSGDMRLNEDPAVSGRHLRIRLETIEPDGEAFVLYDMASSNGTYVGDRETYQAEDSRVYRHVLKDGDFLLVGQTTLVFKQV